MDQYDAHIAEFEGLGAYVLDRKIHADWLKGKGLFQFLCKTGASNDVNWTERLPNIGCPVMVHASYLDETTFQYYAETESLTRAAQQANLPTTSDLLQPKHFQILAQLQRQADLELGRI